MNLVKYVDNLTIFLAVFMHLSVTAFQAFIGFGFLMFLPFCLSEKKRSINWRLILTAFIVQNALFLIISYVPIINSGLSHVSKGVLNLLDYAGEGAKFAFGDFADMKKYGFVFLIVILPTLIFFGALIGALYFFGVIQFIIGVLAFVLRKTVKLSGVESLILIADIFLGQTEGPIVIGPYIKSMTRSELALAFTAGLANMSGSTLGIYLSFLSKGNPTESLIFANYLVTAGVMNAVSAIIFAKLLFPETDFENVSSEKIKITAHFNSSFIESVFQGAITGMKIGATMITVLIAVISLVHMIDGVLGWFGGLIHINGYINSSTNGVFTSFSLEYILGQIFRVFAFFMGVNWGETLNVGSLLGQKVAINEIIAYDSLGAMKSAKVISEHSIFISTFALGSFSNFSSIGISLGVLSVLAPTRQKELTEIAWKCLFGAVLAGFMTAAIAGFWHGILG